LASSCATLIEGKEHDAQHRFKGGLDAGEAESLALATSRRLMVILDDRAVRSFAEVMGVTFLGTVGVLFHAFVKKHLTLAELEDAVEALTLRIFSEI
jgi:predicted nucleic acid-binding protein